MLSKWKNLKRWQKWAIVLACLAVIGKVGEITGLAPKTENKPVKTVQTSTSSKHKEKPKTSKSASSETSSSKTEESKSETKESSSSDKPKDIAENQMGSFIDYFKQDLTDKGLDISTYGFYNRDTILYMTVPNDYKYYDKTDLQKFADGMLAKEHEAFNVWSAINNVNYEHYPMFHIKSDDGSAIASQKLNGEMKVKVK
ncbi:hypothetical protein [uncultured Streptococcus sp.]|uniref:hypothetical protein n=1 Tax=uncultured Streptococcus sp. TaxID=83427 RepID=UPI0028D8A4E0|nr:hypothetical protein [uncultured Streptococcus sp.]